jgi:SAM-dependent methyltransferase
MNVPVDNSLLASSPSDFCEPHGAGLSAVIAAAGSQPPSENGAAERLEERHAYETDPWALYYHRKWGDYAVDVAPIIRTFYEATPTGAAERSLIDICCGTGHLSAIFVEAGYDVLGIDLSDAMIRTANIEQADAVSAGRARFVVGDACAFRVDRPAGLAVATYDALNLLPGLPELRDCFACVAQAVVPGGYFVFDVNTRTGFREDWTGCLVEESDDDFLFVQGLYDGDRRATGHYAGFVRDDDGQWLRFEENPVGYAFEAGEVIDALLDTGWAEARAVEPKDLSRPLEGDKEPARLHIVARRGGGGQEAA